MRAFLLPPALAVTISCLGPAARAVDTDWPAWGGPQGTFASESGHALVTSLADARPLWKSAVALPPMREQSLPAPGGGLAVRHPGGGGGSPVLAGGHVYLAYTVAGGTVSDEERAKRTGRGSHPAHPDIDKIDGEDRLLCLDAATGQVRWQQVFPGQGANWMSGGLGPSNPTPAVGAGVVVAVGSLGVARGFDAETGTPKWEVKLGSRHARLAELKRTSLEKRSAEPMSGYGRELGGAPAFVGGRFILPDWESDLTCGLVALDPETGRETWRVPGVIAEDATPSRWRLRTREFVIAATAGGSVSCLDPSNGRLIWGFTEAGHNPRSITVAGDLALLHLGPVPSSSSERGKPAAKPSRLGALHLRPGGAGVAWETDPELGAAGLNPVAVWSGRAYAHFNKTKTLAVLDLADGRVLARRPSPFDSVAFLGVLDGRLLLERGDGSSSSGEYWMVDAGPEAFAKAEASTWKAPHPPTSLQAGQRNLAYAGGVLVIRGADALYAYDLRAPVAP